ncbi:class I SAM-dependent methyltransferase [Myroides sp. LJL119]
MKINPSIKFLDVEDHSITKERFSLFQDKELLLLKTEPEPDLSQIGRYYQSESYISHIDSKQGFFNRIYQIAKKNSISRKLQWIESIHDAGGTLLDIGCGTGEFLLHAKSKGWNTVGYEPSLLASELAIAKGINLVASTKEIKSGSIEVITLWHVLEHVSDLDKQLLELRRLLKPNGIILVAVPNYQSYDAVYYKEFWAAYDVPRHIWHFSREAMAKLFTSYDFTPIGLQPLYLDSFYISLLSEQYKTGKKNWIKAFWIGLKSNVQAKQDMNYSSLTYIFRKDN